MAEPIDVGKEVPAMIEMVRAGIPATAIRKLLARHTRWLATRMVCGSDAGALMAIADKLERGEGI